MSRWKKQDKSSDDTVVAPPVATSAPAAQRLAKLEKQLQAALTDNDELFESAKTAKATLSVSQSTLELTLKSTSDHLIVTDQAGICTGISRQLARLLRTTARAAVGQPFKDILQFGDSEDGNQQQRRPMTELPQMIIEQASPTPLKFDTKLVIGEDAVAVRLLGSVANTEHSDSAAALIRVVLAEQAGSQPADDLLTGLPGREVFLRRIDGLMATANDNDQSHCLILASVDNLQITIDRYGYRAGEELLRTTSSLIQDAISPLGEAYRVSLSVIGAVVPYGSLEFGRDIGSRILDAVGATQFTFEGKGIEIALSLGVGALRAGSTGAGACIMVAERARMHARASGKNMVVSSEADIETVTNSGGQFVFDATDTAATAQWIRDRIQSGNAHIVSQIIEPLTHRDMAPRHIEVFLRVEDEQGEWLSVHKYFSAIRKMQMSAEVDSWVLSSVIKKLANEPWLVQPEHRVFVNISGSSILEPGFAESIKSMLRKADVDPSALGLEIDEFYASSHLDAVKRFIDSLRPAGVAFALDHCRSGEGMSAFRYLDLDYIKLHGTVVRRAAVDPLDRMALKWFREVAEVTARKTIATGVETNDMLKVVTELGIDFAQGVAVNKLGPLIE